MATVTVQTPDEFGERVFHMAHRLEHGMYQAMAAVADAVQARDDDVQFRARQIERRVIVAYIRDRLDMYHPSACCRVALEDIAANIFTGEHLGAHSHGELDDLLANPLRMPEPEP